jgi:formylglycine-generating enzyme required for sulfatase activity/transcriptional regulator with XRE-family HTH domain
LTGEDLGATLRQWRLEERLSQRDLALRMGFHEAVVASVERGERAPSAQYLDGFSAAVRLDRTRIEQMWQLYRHSPEPSAAASGVQEAAVCPYRGLLAFREQDSPLYYGRERAVRLVARKLEQAALVGIVGASGSGKSSAVFAGAVPRLRRTGPWEVVAFRPGGDPFAALGQALTGSPAPAGSHAHLASLIARRAESTRRPLLIVGDQLEELFTHGSDDALVADFLGALVSVVRSAALVQIKVLVTFRGDFYGHVLTHRGFSDALQDHIVHLPPMSRTELAQAITEPARVAGLKLDEGLAERVLDDAGTEPGALPLLEFALTRLWETRAGQTLTHEGYDRIGRLTGAITSRAEDVYRSLSAEQQYTARQLLIRLVQVARPEQDGNDARRRTPLRELSSLPRCESVVHALANARLVVTDATADGLATAELAHEAIIRGWGRLSGWLVEDRQFLLWQQRVRRWFDEWRLSADKHGALLRGSILEEAMRWMAAKGRESIAPDLLDYLDGSIHQHSIEKRRHALEQIDRLLTIRPADVPAQAAAFIDADPALRASLRERLESATPAECWRLRIALLPHDSAQAALLLDELARLRPDDLVPVRDMLHAEASTIIERLWRQALAAFEHAQGDELLCAAVLLAGFSPDDTRWDTVAPLVAGALIVQNQLTLRTFVDALRPARAHLLEPLYALYTDDKEHRAATHEVIATIVRDLAADNPDFLARMAAAAPLGGANEAFNALQHVVTPSAVAVLHQIAAEPAAQGSSERQRVLIGRRRCAALTTLLRLGEDVDLDDLLGEAADPELGTQFAYQARARGVPVETLVEQLEAVRAARARYYLLLSLRDYPINEIPPLVRERAVAEATRLRREDGHPGVHAAAAWSMRNLRVKSGLRDDDATRAAYDPTGERGWFTVDVEDTRMTFVVYRPGSFIMGSPADEAERSDYESPCQDTTLTRSFALARREVSRAEFEAFMRQTNTLGLPDIDEWSPLGTEPVVAPTWFESVRFALWYQVRATGDDPHGYPMLIFEPSSPSWMPDRAVGDFRLPTEAEWEYACRSGTTTAYSFGSDRSLLDRYGWFADNSGLKTHEPGLLRPNPTGLFNIHGQCWEWCLDWYAPYSGEPVTDPAGPREGDRKVLRGGCWNLGARYARSACRNAHIPPNRNYYISFRLALTVPEIDPTWTPDQPNPLPWSG